MKKLQPMAVGVRKWYGINLAAAVTGLILMLLLPQFYSLFIEKVILGRKLKMLIPVILGYLLIQAANTGVAFLRKQSQYKITNQVTVKMKERMLHTMLRRPFTDYDKMNVGEQKMTMDDAVVKMEDFTNTQSVEYGINVCRMIVLFVLLCFLEWHLALILVVSIPLTFWLNHIIGKVFQKNGEESWENDQAFGAWIYSSLSGWREIRALNLGETCLERFVSYARRYMELFSVWIEFWVLRFLIIPRIKDDFLLQFLLYFIGGLLIFRGNITIGALLVFAQYFKQLVECVESVVTADTDLQANMVFYDRAVAAIDETVEEDTGKKTDIRECSLSFRNVSFAYEDADSEILTDFSMDIRQGERVGIVGESGRGKTTMLKMIIGMLQPTKGKIIFGGDDLKELSLQALHRKIGVVMQENMLFNTTIHENLLYGNENASREDMERACKRANIDGFIRELPDGYETVIGEKGIKLSGGQKQRLVLARLFLRDVDMFIFDEATSALDQNSESIVQQAVESIGRDKTILVVAHRQSSLNLCDRLVHL